jgi:hypothetical protein
MKPRSISVKILARRIGDKCNIQSDPKVPLPKYQFSFRGSTAVVALGRLTFEVSRSHTDTPHSVGLLWMSDRPTSVSQHTTLSRYKHPFLGGIRTHSPSKRADADHCRRQRGHWDRRNTGNKMFF